MYTIWAVFGGFILHFLLSNYLNVLLRPNYEKPVDTAADLISRDIRPVVRNIRQIYVQIFANSPDPIYQELSRRIIVAGRRREYAVKYERPVRMCVNQNYALLYPPRPKSVEDKAHYSSEEVKGLYHFPGSIANKKWPLKKVYKSSSIRQHE